MVGESIGKTTFSKVNIAEMGLLLNHEKGFPAGLLTAWMEIDKNIEENLTLHA